MPSHWCARSTAVAASKGFLIATLLLPAVAIAGGAQIGDAVAQVFRAGSYSKVARIASLTTLDLRHASRADNIAGLFRLADAEGRVDPVRSQHLWGSYNAIPSGDALLLRCLKSPVCDPSICASIAGRSELHAEVLLRRPDLNLTQANQAVGSISEQVMIRHFEESGWTRIEGQIGRTGIDGLFIKRRGDAVQEVLIVESKYNTGTLQPTDHGLQMSRDWALRKLTELRGKHPDNPTYPQIATYIQQGFYRARLWNMKVDNGVMKIDLQRVHSKGSDVDLLDDPGTRIAVPPKIIRLSAPENDFERALVRQYRQALEKLAPSAT